MLKKCVHETEKKIKIANKEKTGFFGKGFM